MIKPFNHLLNKYLLKAYHVPGIMTSVKTVLKDAGNIVCRIDEKLEQFSSFGEITDSSVVWENLLGHFSEQCIYAFSELNCVPPEDTQVLTSSTWEFWK